MSELSGWSRPKLHVYKYQSNNIKITNKLAIFDMSNTLMVVNESKLMDNRKNKLTKLFKQGYTLVVVTNQGHLSWDKPYDRINDMVELLGLPITIYSSNAIDYYRKPNVGIWNLIKNDFIFDSAFMVGDSPADQGWAQNANIDFFWAKDFFSS